MSFKWMNKRSALSALMVIVLLIGSLAVFTGCNGEETTTTTTTTTTTVASTTETTKPAPLKPQVRLRVATTTSLYDTGLWGYLEPMFEEMYDVELDVLYAGTGKAIDLGQRGDVDVITVHSKSREQSFIDEGYGVERVPFAYNYFLIVGPESDPAGIKGMTPEDAFKTLMDTGSGTFISRGDDSGTHKKEKLLWQEAGITPSGSWYKEAGQGMEAVITMADDMQAYSLTDRGTYLASKERIKLVILLAGDPALFNPYGIIAVNPTRHPHVNYNAARRFMDWITAEEGQKIIANFKKNGEMLFYPDAVK